MSDRRRTREKSFTDVTTSHEGGAPETFQPKLFQFWWAGGGGREDLLKLKVFISLLPTSCCNIASTEIKREKTRDTLPPPLLHLHTHTVCNNGKSLFSLSLFPFRKHGEELTTSETSFSRRKTAGYFLKLNFSREGILFTSLHFVPTSIKEVQLEGCRVIYLQYCSHSEPAFLHPLINEKKNSMSVCM